MRILIATLSGVAFVVGWISAAAVLGDRVRGLPVLVQLAYYAFAGFAWVFPARWLMLWAARLR